MGGEIQNTIINNNIATGHASKVTCEQVISIIHAACCPQRGI